MTSYIASVSKGWESPSQLVQGELFTRPVDELLALARVSIEEMEDWRSVGWISYDVRDLATLDQAEVYEMIFVRNIARAGLNREQVTSLLAELERPYRYDPCRVAYSFADGWVQLPRLPGVSERDEYMRDNCEAWISRLEEEQDLATPQQLIFKIISATTRLRGGESKEDDEQS